MANSVWQWGLRWRILYGTGAIKMIRWRILYGTGAEMENSVRQWGQWLEKTGEKLGH